MSEDDSATGWATSGSQVCANGGLVLIAETLVHILVHEGGLSDPSARGGKIEGLSVEPPTDEMNSHTTYPLSPRMITYAERQLSSLATATNKGVPCVERGPLCSRVEAEKETMGGGSEGRVSDLWT